MAFLCDILNVQLQGKDRVMTRKTKKTWITLCCQTSQVSITVSSCAFYHKAEHLALSSHSHSPTLEFKNLNSSMTLLALHSSRGSFPKRCPWSAYKLLKCSACLEVHTCVSNLFSLKMNKSSHRSCLINAQLPSILRVFTVQSLKPNTNELTAKKRCKAKDHKSRVHIIGAPEIR